MAMANKDLIEIAMQRKNLKCDKEFQFKDEKTVYRGCLKKKNGEFGLEIIDYKSEDIKKLDLTIIVQLLFTDKYEIILKPFLPEDEEKYFYIGADNNIFSDDWMGSAKDKAMYLVGNCFRTKEEAKENRDKVLKILSGKPLIDFRYENK